LILLRNAVEAEPKGGNDRIDAAREADHVTITVSDDGPGVPGDLRERIFNPFFTTRDAGTGLGLAIVHRIAEAHGGSVRVTAGADGAPGACFVLTLPAAGMVAEVC